MQWSFYQHTCIIRQKLQTQIKNTNCLCVNCSSTDKIAWISLLWFPLNWRNLWKSFKPHTVKYIASFFTLAFLVFSCSLAVQWIQLPIACHLSTNVCKFCQPWNAMARNDIIKILTTGVVRIRKNMCATMNFTTGVFSSKTHVQNCI